MAENGPELYLLIYMHWFSLTLPTDLCDGECQENPIVNSVPTAPPLPRFDPDENLYCFPPLANRVRYSKAWGQYLVDVKESPFYARCGPGGNRFSRDTLSFDENRQELKLEYKFVHGRWKASEARILPLPLDGPFSYGQYSFRIKTVRVLDDTETRVVVTNQLPPNLVLGMFTFDPTLRSDTMSAPYNREIDIEISHWGNIEAGDLHFLVQPWSFSGPHYPTRDAPLFTGQDGKPAVGGGHFYNFTWNPTSIQWSTSSSGTDRTYEYKTIQSRELCTEDYVQCPGSNVEIRVNLWNMRGSVAPDLSHWGVQQDEDNRCFSVQVVMDMFQYTPSFSSIEDGGAQDGAVCSKDCQCRVSSECTPEGRCALRGTI